MQRLNFFHVLVFEVPARKVAAQQHLVGAFGFHQKGQGILAVDGGIERDLSPLVGKGAREKTLAPRAALKGLLEAEWIDRFMFQMLDAVDPEQIAASVKRAVAVFMAAYGPPVPAS